ncbi:MAG: metallophosphoesterase [Lactobacillaceae bacterium]|nr:metallophosphoesterase [Lactobacillaceae bacterium]
MNQFLKIENLGKTISISDIHGNWEVLKEIKNIPEYHDPNYTLIFNGDYTDGGDTNPRDPKKVIDFITDEVNNYGAIAIHGNHDEMLFGTAKGDQRRFLNWQINDMAQTLKQFGINDYQNIDDVANQLNDKFSSYIQMLEQSPYAVESKKKLFIHAGVNWQLKDYHETPIDDLMWIRENYFFDEQILKEHGKWNEDIYVLNGVDQSWHTNNTKKVMVTGHTPTYYFQKDINNPITEMRHFEKDIPRYDIDGGSHGFAGAGLNLLILDEDGSVIRTDKLHAQK